VISARLYGLGRNLPPLGRSSNVTLAPPDVAMILIGGQRPRIAAASFKPSMEPGICTSVKTTVMSNRLSKMTMASSELAASTTV
jgi:hypothetical protein